MAGPPKESSQSASDVSGFVKFAQSAFGQAIIIASAAFAMFAGGVSVLYTLYPPPAPPPLCFEYNLRLQELEAERARHQAELQHLQRVQSGLSVELTDLERTIGRRNDLERSQVIRQTVSEIRLRISRRLTELENEFGLDALDKDARINTIVHPMLNEAWEHFLNDIGFPNGIEAQRNFRYWLDDFTEMTIDDIVWLSPISRQDVVLLDEFLKSVEVTAGMNYDTQVSNLLHLPRSLQHIGELFASSSVYEPDYFGRITLRLIERRVFVENRLYEIERDIFRARNSFSSVSDQQSSVEQLSVLADCVKPDQ